MIHSAFNNRTFSFDLRLFLFFTNRIKLRKGLLPPVISFYDRARCLFIFLNIADTNAISQMQLGVSLKVKLITSAKFSKSREKKVKITKEKMKKKKPKLHKI